MNIVPLIKKDFKLFFKTKSAVALTYIVPMIITLIFGAVFGGFGGTGGGINKIKIIMVDNDHTEQSQRFLSQIDSLDAIRVYTKYKAGEEYVLFDDAKMDEWIKDGKRKLGISIPAGFKQKVENGETLPLEVHFDPKFAVEYNVIRGVIQQVVMQTFPDLMLGGMMSKARSYLGDKEGNEFQSGINNVVKQYFPEEKKGEDGTIEKNSGMPMKSPVDVKSVKLIGEEHGNAMFAQYVAGMAVLFLLFSVTHAGASLLDEKHDGTIKRLLTAPVKRSEILFSKMLYITILAISQLVVLFIFGWLVFGLNIFLDIPALLTMIVITALACSALGIFIASICKNQQQVGSVSTLLILGMSALGGSMFPSFIMPKYIQTIGKFTLNHWAMKGFTDIFWYNKHLSDIYPSILILAGITIIFSFIAIKLFHKRLMES